MHDESSFTRLSNTAHLEVNWLGTARSPRRLGYDLVVSVHVRRSIQEGAVDAHG